jgi:hypothetical protein
MKKVALLSLFALLFLTTFANAATLFYGGDFDPNNGNANGLANETDAIVGGSPYGAATYQNFIVGGGGWNVAGLFTNNLNSNTPTSGYWEIRSGVSEGNGGTLVASGTGSITNDPTGRSGFGYTETHNEVDGLNVSLAPGTYWEAVVPVSSTGGRTFESNTFGANSIGSQTSDQQFWNSNFFGVNYTNADTQGVFSTFSSGVIGTEVPEPSSLIMLGSGLVGVAGVIRRRLAR